MDKNSQAWFQLSGDLKNAGVGRIPGGVVALVEDEERDVPEPEDDVTKIVRGVCGVMTSTPDPSIMTRQVSAFHKSMSISP